MEQLAGASRMLLTKIVSGLPLVNVVLSFVRVMVELALAELVAVPVNATGEAFSG